ncbi:MAG: protein tyrosine phosphatase family protein [Gammaproteobacteria bacterium]|nr:protein tyrosine phosphatase family protein [Gammaproteobacteria bacterium]
MTKLLAVCALTMLSIAAWATGIDDISNFRQYSDNFASSGQPTERQLQLLQEDGFERVVYIAYSDHRNSLKNEDRLVKKLGMEYLHIPVEWERPTKSDFYLFAGALQKAPDKKTLLHCQVNFRASAFSFLYRVIYEGVPLAQAKADMNTVWTPNETWKALIFDLLEENGIAHQCDGCDWSAKEMQH